ncbi:MAG TPA: hypothetical protein VMX13_17960, partial [Sedimentisphaerales bacterium]|nr:hypothetical protein [Sedimentisphaerales bacterium]
MNTIHRTARCPRSCIKVRNTPAVGQTATFRALAFLIMTMVSFSTGAAAEKKEPVIIGHEKVGGASVASSRYIAATFDRPRNYNPEAWPAYHIRVL